MDTGPAAQQRAECSIGEMSRLRSAKVVAPGAFVPMKYGEFLSHGAAQALQYLDSRRGIGTVLALDDQQQSEGDLQ